MRPLPLLTGRMIRYPGTARCPPPTTHTSVPELGGQCVELAGIGRRGKAEASSGLHGVRLATVSPHFCRLTSFLTYTHTPPRPQLRPSEYQNPGAWSCLALSGPVPQARGASTQGPTEGVAPGNCGGDLFAPTPQECAVPSGAAQIPEQSQPDTARCVCPVGTRSARHQRAGGWRLVPAAHPRTRQRRPGCPDRGRPLLFPAPPHPLTVPPASRPCWNVTGVVARACPDCRNTAASARKASLSPQLWLDG